MARPERFELPTPWFVARYSIQLSYGRVLLRARILPQRISRPRPKITRASSTGYEYRPGPESDPSTYLRPAPVSASLARAASKPDHPSAMVVRSRRPAIM